MARIPSIRPLLAGFAVTGLLAAGVVATAAPAQADSRTCTGTLGKGTVDGDVIVPVGKKCTLRGTLVKGNVRVWKDARLHAVSARIEGNIQTDRHRNVVVQKSRIDGDVQLRKGYQATLTSNVIDGNIQSSTNRGSQSARYNRVDGDIQYFSNRPARYIKISANRVDGNLQCKSNTRTPLGGGNTVNGDKEGQCARL